MIMSIITAIMARWQIAAGVVALLIATHTLAYCEGREDAKERAEAEAALVRQKALERARTADSAAQAVVTEGQNDVAESNQRARDAAAGSDDPLRAALERLRAERAGSGSPARDPR